MAPEVDSDDENVEYEDESGNRYRLYLDELEGGGNPGASCKDSGGEMKVLQGKNRSNFITNILKCESLCVRHFDAKNERNGSGSFIMHL